MATSEQILESYQRISSTLIVGTGKFVSNTFSSLGSWRDSDIDAYARAIAPYVIGAKRQIANLELAKMKALATISGVSLVLPQVSAIDLTTNALRNGANAAQVVERPFVSMRMKLAQGSTVSAAIAAGAARAASIFSTDVQLARRATGLAARSSTTKIKRYARVLTGSSSCALCYVASTNTYGKQDLLPIHAGCDCGVREIYDAEAFQEQSTSNLNATHEALDKRFGKGNTFDSDLSKVIVQEHGELGPVLTIKGQKFTGPNDLPPTREWQGQRRR